MFSVQGRKRTGWILVCTSGLAAALAVWLFARDPGDGLPKPTERAPNEEQPQPQPGLVGGSSPTAAVSIDAEVPSTPGDSPQSPLAPDGGIEGIVRDTRTQLGVPGIKILAWLMEEDSLAELPDLPHATSVSDEKGMFRLPFAVSSSSERLRIRVEEGEWLYAGWREEGRRVLARVGRPFRLRGVVEGPDGRPVAGVYLENGARTDSAGRFEIGPFVEDPEREQPRPLGGGSGDVVFTAPGYSPFLMNPHSVPRDDRDHVRVVLTRGFTVGGILRNHEGRPLDSIVVQVTGDGMIGSHARTDDEGYWEVDRIRAGKVTIIARDFAHQASGRREIVVSSDVRQVELATEPIRLPEGLRRVSVLGLVIADADDEVRAAFHLPAYVRVVVLDPGPYVRDVRADWRSGRTIGLDHGDGLKSVGGKYVRSVREVVERVLVGERHVEGYYTRGDTTKGPADLEGTEDQLAELRVLLDRLPR